jgi:hypothetical protein
MRLRNLLVLAGMAFSLGQAAIAQESSPGGASPVDASGAIELPEVEVEAVSGNANTSAMQAFQNKMNAMDQSRDNFLLPKFGATSYNMDREALEALPQGDNTPIDKVLLQAPGVSYDSAVSNPDFHVRNEYANVQYRINGILLPEGVSGLGPVLETGFIGNLNLLDGALPAQYGLRTAGVVDLTTRSEFTPGGSLSLYGGSFGTISPSFNYGGSSGETQYFFTGRYMQNNEGLENATPTVDPIHDHTEQGKFFGYVSTMLGDSTRLTLLDKGAALPFDKKAAKLLVEEAFQKPARRRKSITRRCGWAKDRSYVRPDFTVGPRTGTLNLHETAIDREIDSRKGNASEWRDGLRGACLASSYLSIGIGIAYGAPLLAVLGEDEGAIFNFHGESSTGKSLLGRACQSGFARARKNDVATYNLSGPGLDQLCFARNDLVMVLDEEGTAEGNRQKRREDIRKIAFTVPGGRGRIIDKNYRREREMVEPTWRLFAISSGESPLEDKAIGNVRASGERVRHIDIRVPKREKNGIFNRLEGKAKDRKSAAAGHAAAVEAALADNYGVAFGALSRCPDPNRP